MLKMTKAAMCALVLTGASGAAAQDDIDFDQALADDEVTCTWVESHNTYYCETGSFDDLVGNCLITGNSDSCCVATGDPGICSSGSGRSPNVRTILTWLFDGQTVATFARPDEEKRRGYEQAP